MATQPSEEQGDSNHAEPAAGTCSSSNREKICLIDGVPNMLELKKGKEKHAKDLVLTLSPADIENASVSVGSVPSQSGGAPGISEEQVNEPYYRPLVRAAFKGDWEFATRFFEGDSASKKAKITNRSETLLHVAALSAQDQFLEKLVELFSLDPEALEMVDCDGRTALHNAVLCGSIRMVKALVRSNPKLTQLADNKGRAPLGISALEASRHKEIAWFLAKNTTDDGPSHPFSSSSAIDTIIDLTYNGHHDITLYLVRRYPHLLIAKRASLMESLLHALAMSQYHWPSGTKLSFLEALIYKCMPVDLSYKPTDKNSDPVLQILRRSLWNVAKIGVPIIKRVHEVKLRHMAALELTKQVCIAISYKNIIGITDFFDMKFLLYQATIRGVNEFIKCCIQFFPELIWSSPYGKRLIAHAVAFHQERILGLFLKVNSTNELSLLTMPTWQESSDMMWAAVQYTPMVNRLTNVAGAAFEMQREIQWYKAVEEWVISSVRTEIVDNKKLFWQIFVENRNELLKNGEKWAKDTSNSCMLVSTLIATVLFAAAFTIPGGNDNNTGVPLLLGQNSFMVFTISDALGLFSSVTAILLFLAILTSRFEAQDFLYSLPKKIIMGLSLLFLSLAFMLVAFAATLTIVLDERLEWALIPITLLASVPVALFVVLQLPLLYQMVKSTYGPSIFCPEGIWDGVNYTKQDQ
ncbi:hypothetical protein BT93_C1987 [Corymbia citriodora subsp. variegata]|nr:hypothetical protein BT93_C1987 [Corymbia citriodora subsp. variegata]